MRFHSVVTRTANQHRSAIWAGMAMVVALGVGCTTQTQVGSGTPQPPSHQMHAGAPVQDAQEQERRLRIRLELAANYLQAGQSQVALGEVDQALAINPRSADAFNLQGLALMNLQDFAAAQASFDKANALQPNDPYTLHNMAWLQCMQGRYDKGVAEFVKVLQMPRYNEPARSWLAKGMCERRSGDHAAAEQSLFKAYEMDAGNPMIAYHLADLLFRRQELERARFYIRRINNGEYANAESLWLGIRVERALGDNAAMQQLASQLQRRFPDSKEWQRFEQGAFSG